MAARVPWCPPNRVAVRAKSIATALALSSGSPSQRRDGFDLQQEIRIRKSAQHTKRAGRRIVAKILLEKRAGFRHVVRITNVDCHLHHILQAGTAFLQSTERGSPSPFLFAHRNRPAAIPCRRHGRRPGQHRRRAYSLPGRLRRENSWRKAYALLPTTCASTLPWGSPFTARCPAPLAKTETSDNRP